MEKQDAILRALVYDEEVSLAVIDMTQTVNEAVRIHDLSALSAAALGRTLIAAAYMCSSLKEEKGALSVTVRGDGVGGGIYVSGDKALHMRGYIENPHAELPLNAKGKLDVGGCVGSNGYLSVVRDDGENVPFVGTTPLVSGGRLCRLLCIQRTTAHGGRRRSKDRQRRHLHRRGRRVFAASARRKRREHCQGGKDHRRILRDQYALRTFYGRRDIEQIFRYG